MLTITPARNQVCRIKPFSEPKSEQVLATLSRLAAGDDAPVAKGRLDLNVRESCLSEHRGDFLVIRFIPSFSQKKTEKKDPSQAEHKEQQCPAHQGERLEKRSAARSAPLNYEQPQAQEPQQKEGQRNQLHARSPSAVSPPEMTRDSLTVAEGNTSTGEIVGGEFNRDDVPR